MVGEADLVGGRYRLQEKISSDDWAVLYEGAEEGSGRKILVDILQREDDTLRDDLRKRARAAAVLTHPGIARVLDVGEDNGKLFVVTEIVVGRSLAEHARRGEVSLQQAAAWCAEVLDALAHTHDAGIAHGDIRSSRVIVPEGGRSRITGFTDPRVTATKRPEVAGDLAQTGALLYQLAGGDVAEESLPRALVDFVERWSDAASLPAGASAARMRAELLELRTSLGEKPDEDAAALEDPASTVWPIPGRRYDPTRLGRRVIAVAIALALIALGAFLWRVTTRVDDVDPPVPPPTVSPQSAALTPSGNHGAPASVSKGDLKRGRVNLRSASEAAHRPLSRDISADGRGTSAEATNPGRRSIKLIH